MKTKLITFLILPFSFVLNATAGSATWNLNPTSGDWGTPTNWTPNTVPNGPTDVATFDVSDITDVTLSTNAITEVASIVFNPGANSFNLAAVSPSLQQSVTLNISGDGIVNNSGVTQTLSANQPGGDGGTISFLNSASAGDRINLTAFGATAAGQGVIDFFDTSTAGTANVVLGGALADGNSGGVVVLNQHANMGDASVTINESEVAGGEGGHMPFNGHSSAGNATFVINSATAPGHGAGSILFISNASAGNATFTLNGSTTPSGEVARIDFIGIFPELCTARNGLFTINGGKGAGAAGGIVDFDGEPGPPLNVTAGTATLVNNGGDGTGALGGETIFESYSTAGQATLIANGGTNGGAGGVIMFEGAVDAAQARIELFGNGRLDPTIAVSLSVGSIEGDGLIDLSAGHTALTTGANNLSTTFSGLIAGVGGSLTKIGTGTLTLTGANTYTGTTTIEAGQLVVSNSTGSGTGTGPVKVNAGQLAGSGTISSAVTIGTGSGPGAFLAPAAGTKKTAKLTIQNALTFNADGTYTYAYRAKKATAKTDLVVANGILINTGATVNFDGTIKGRLTPGLTFTLINNTSAVPIIGTFSNLPDGGTIVLAGNTLQANYEGGDGNDLTLSVVP